MKAILHYCRVRSFRPAGFELKMRFFIAFIIPQRLEQIQQEMYLTAANLFYKKLDL